MQAQEIFPVGIATELSQNHCQIPSVLRNHGRGGQIVRRTQSLFLFLGQDGIIARMVVQIGDSGVKHILPINSCRSAVGSALTRRISSARTIR